MRRELWGREWCLLWNFAPYQVTGKGSVVDYSMERNDPKFLFLSSAVICSSMGKTESKRNSRWRFVCREMWSWVGWITSRCSGKESLFSWGTNVHHEMILHYLGKNIYVWIYEKDAKELNSRAKRALSSGQKLSQRRRYKILKESQSFFSSCTRLPSFHCRPFSIFCPCTWLGGGLKG